MRPSGEFWLATGILILLLASPFYSRSVPSFPGLTEALLQGCSIGNTVEKELTLKALQGKIVLLNFWATW